LGEKSLSTGGSPLTNIINSGEIEMIKLIIGILIGFFVATHGVSGVADIVDGGLKAVKNVNIK
jgi:hypothetical protein